MRRREVVTLIGPANADFRIWRGEESIGSITGQLQGDRMQLSLEEYQSLLESLRPLGMRRPSEKPKHLRIGTTSRVTMVPLDAGEALRPFSVALSDVSRKGLCLVRDVPFKVGQQFILCLTRYDSARTRPVVCVV